MSGGSCAFLDNVSLRCKVIVLTAVPLAALLGIGSSDVLHYRTLQIEDEHFVELVELGAVASDLVHEVQRERGR